MKFKLATLFLFVMVVGMVDAATPKWIWNKGPAAQRASFKKTFTIDGVPEHAPLKVTCDNGFRMKINGKLVGQSAEWKAAVRKNVAEFLKVGENIITVEAENEGNIGGFVMSLDVGAVQVVSDKSWQIKTSGDWGTPREVAKYGAGPWGHVLDQGSGKGQGGSSVGQGKARRPSRATIPVQARPGFKVEQIYKVNKGSQGSWVGMTVDAKGRLITTDQYGGVYRVTLTPECPCYSR